MDGGDGQQDAAVAAFLAKLFKGRVDALERISHGEWSRAFTFRRDGGEYVVRFSATDEDFLKDRRATGYAAQNLPMPKVVDIGEAFGAFYAISERAPGEFFDTLYSRGAWVLFTRPALYTIGAIGLAGVIAFVYLVAGRYGTPFVVARKTVLPGLFAFACLPVVSWYLKPDHAQAVGMSLLAGLILVAHRRNFMEEFSHYMERRHAAIIFQLEPKVPAGGELAA